MNCTICEDSTEIKSIFKSSKYGLRDIIKCNKCNHFMDLTTFKNERTIKQGGVPSYKLTSKDKITKFIKHKKENFLEGIINNLRKLGMNKKTELINFLDFGCGGGEVVLAGNDIFQNSNGVNISNDYYKYILDKLEINDKKVFNLVTDSVDKLNKKYDLVISWHVLEHFQYPQDFINIIKKVVNGYIFIQVPILSDNCIAPNHYNYFTEESIKIIFEKNNFYTLKCYQDEKCINYIALVQTR